MKIRVVPCGQIDRQLYGHTDGQTNRNDEAHSWISQFLDRA